MGVEVQERDRGSADLARRLGALGQSMTFGVHSDAAPYPDGTDVVAVAAAQEFGSAEIPQRSYLRGFVDSGGKKTIADAAQAQVLAVIDGADPDSVGEAMGNAAVEGVLDFMAKGIRGVNHPGYTGETVGTVRTLDRTGHLRSQITAKAGEK